jgi:hypothetical protein
MLGMGMFSMVSRLFDQFAATMPATFGKFFRVK